MLLLQKMGGYVFFPEPTKVPIEYIILIETVKLKDVR
jgi:hypothetical protein